MSSHVDLRVNDTFLAWLNSKYGKYGEVKGLQAKYHDFLGIKIDFCSKKHLILDMRKYVRNMLDDFPIKFGKDDTLPTPATNNLLEAGNGKPLFKAWKEQFYSIVAKGLSLTKRARPPDVHIVIAILSTRAKEPTESDWAKLVQVMKYLHSAWLFTLTITAQDILVIKWTVDASSAVHPDFKSHTGGNLHFGGILMGSIVSLSRKQKLNTKSSTEAELVAANDISSLILWTQLFMEEQGYPIERNLLYQDNKSAILLEQNGKKSSSKRTRHKPEYQVFFLTDHHECGYIAIEYCPTDEMVGNYMAKLLQVSKFLHFREMIVGLQHP